MITIEYFTRMLLFTFLIASLSLLPACKSTQSIGKKESTEATLYVPDQPAFIKTTIYKDQFNYKMGLESGGGVKYPKQYYTVETFGSLFLATSVDWYVYNAKTRTLSPTKYDRRELYMDDNKYRINIYDKKRNASLTGYTDLNYEPVIDIIYKNIGYFTDGVCVASDVEEKNKHYLIDETGKIIQTLNYKQITPFREGMALVVSQEGLRGFINLKGEEVIPAIFEKADFFSDGWAKVSENGQEYFIDKEGEKVLELPEDVYAREGFNDGFVAIKGESKDYPDHYASFMNKKGERPFRYFSFVDDFNNGIALVTLDEQEGFINSRGQLHLLPECERLYNNDPGLIKCITNEDKQALLDTTGQIIIPPKYDFIDYGDSIIRVRKGDFEGIIDKNEHIIMPLIYNKIVNYSNGIALVYMLNHPTKSYGKRYFFVDKKGNPIDDQVYDYGKILSSDFYLLGKYNYELLDEQGQSVYQFDSLDRENSSNEILYHKKDNQEKCIQTALKECSCDGETYKTAMAYLLYEKYETSIDFYNELIAAYPDDYLSINNRAWAKLVANPMSEEVAKELMPAIDRAVKNNLYKPSYRDTKALALLYIKEYDAALSVINAAIEMNGKSPYFYATKAYIFSKMEGQTDAFNTAVAKMKKLADMSFKVPFDFEEQK